MSGPANFDPLASIYRALEIVAFGGDLARARFCLLDRLSDRRSILVLGEGDGRCLERLVRLAPAARIHCFDASPAMLARARARIAGTEAEARVTFTHADLRHTEFPVGAYDAVVTLFFLDCFDAATAAEIVTRAARALRPDSRWLFADFAVPPRGFRRLRARLWLALLYAFFRQTTKLTVDRLPPSEALIRATGFVSAVVRERQLGLLRTVVFSQPASAT